MAKRSRNNMIKTGRAQFEALSKEDQSKLAWWLALMTDPSRVVRWTESLRNVCGTLVTSPTPEAAALFWVRLYGVLDEVTRDHEPWDYDECNVRQDPAGSNEERLAWVEATNREHEADVLRACQKLAHEFSDDELLLIQWKREGGRSPDPC